MGFRFFEEFWNKGFATESALACLHFGFNNLNLNKIIGRGLKENTTSINVLEKIGMIFSKKIDFNRREGVIYKAIKKP